MNPWRRSYDPMYTKLFPDQTCAQYYKTSTILIYDSSVVPDLKLPHITTLEP